MPDETVELAISVLDSSILFSYKKKYKDKMQGVGTQDPTEWVDVHMEVVVSGHAANKQELVKALRSVVKSLSV